MKNISQRTLFFIGCLLCGFLMIAALFMQYVLKLEPCPLCIVQRVVVVCLGLLFAFATLQKPAKLGGRIYGVLLLFFSVLGVAVAGRHVWLQHNPNAVSTSCGASLDYMLNTLPFHETLKLIFLGTGECSKVDWTFLGLSIAEMTLIAFVFFTVYSIVCFFKSNNK